MSFSGAFKNFPFSRWLLISGGSTRTDYNTIFYFVSWAVFSWVFIKWKDFLTIFDCWKDSLVISHPLLARTITLWEQFFLHLSRWQWRLRLDWLWLMNAMHTVSCFCIQSLTRIMVSSCTPISVCWWYKIV